MEVAAQNPKLFLAFMEKKYGWEIPADPMKVGGPLYFVGTKGLSVWLITTSEGLILMNTGMPGSGPMIEASIRKLGFKPEDIKIMLAGHAHIDHVGGHAYMKKLTHAQVVMLDSAVDLLESGGKNDFNYAGFPEFTYEPVKVDRVIRDGDTVRLGDVMLTAIYTPGHTRGSTTRLMNVTDGGKAYKVIFPDGAGFNPGYRLAVNPSYPGIGDDYRRTFFLLEMQRPDIWLFAHTDALNLDEKRVRTPSEGIQAWVNPEGYRKWVVSSRAAFEAEVDKEMSVTAMPK
jgi:metallo-beta-lactamase class B